MDERARREPLRRELRPLVPPPMLLRPLVSLLLELSELDPDVLFMPLLVPVVPFVLERLRSTSPPEVPVAPLLDGMHVVELFIPADEPVLPMLELEPLMLDELMPFDALPVLLPIELLLP